MFGFPSTDTMDDLGPINPSCWANSLIKTGMDSGTIVENAKQTSWECSGIYNDIHIYIYLSISIQTSWTHHGISRDIRQLSTQLAGVCHALESQLGIRLDVSN